jgi:hypothetical protein
MRRLPLLCLALCSLALPAVARTYVVTPAGTGDFGTIQAALDAVSAGDVIELTNGTFTGPGNRDLDYLGKAVTVRSMSGNPDHCIIDCEGSEADPHRGFIFQGAEGPGSIVRAITIENGYTGDDQAYWEDYGGGVRIDPGASPHFENVVIRNCTAPDGGAVMVYDGAPTFLRCRFESNLGWWGSAGGVIAALFSGEFRECVFDGNHTNQVGGGMRLLECENAVLKDCWFKNNTVEGGGYGGGLDISGGHVMVQGCTFSGNHFSPGAGWGGGGMCCSWGSASVSHCTFVNNDSYGGSAISVPDGAVVTVQNSILAFGDHPPVGYDPGFGQGSITLSCCDLYGNAGGNWVGFIAGQLGIDGNISLDPLICNPDADDFVLWETSPCAPFTPPNEECDLIGAWPVGCEVSSLFETAQARVPAIRIAPNPGLAECRIAFEWPGSGSVSVEVLDAAGRVVRSLIAGADPGARSGEFNLTWDGLNQAGAHVPAGVYWIRVAASGTIARQSFILLR